MTKYFPKFRINTENFVYNDRDQDAVAAFQVVYSDVIFLLWAFPPGKPILRH